MLPIKALKKLSKEFHKLSGEEGRAIHPFLNNKQAVDALLSRGALTQDSKIRCPVYPEDETPPRDIACSEREWLAARQESLRHLSLAWEVAERALVRLSLTKYATNHLAPGETIPFKWNWEVLWLESETPRRSRTVLTAIAFATKQAQVDFPSVLGDLRVVMSLCPEILDEDHVDPVALANAEDRGDASLDSHSRYIDTKCARMLPSLDGSNDADHNRERARGFYARLRQYVICTFLFALSCSLNCGHCGHMPLLAEDVAATTGKFSVALLCGRCRIQNYCSPTCQKTHWYHRGYEGCYLLGLCGFISSLTTFYQRVITVVTRSIWVRKVSTLVHTLSRCPTTPNIVEQLLLLYPNLL